MTENVGPRALPLSWQEPPRDRQEGGIDTGAAYYRELLGARNEAQRLKVDNENLRAQVDVLTQERDELADIVWNKIRGARVHVDPATGPDKTAVQVMYGSRKRDAFAQVIPTLQGKKP